MVLSGFGRGGWRLGRDGQAQEDSPVIEDDDRRPSPNPLGVTLELEGDVAIVGVAGDVDATTCDDLIRIIGGARSIGARSFILDFADTSYLDSSGIRFLVDLHRALQADGGTITVRHASVAVRRVIQITGLD